jgi:hypothetical protein
MMMMTMLSCRHCLAKLLVPQQLLGGAAGCSGKQQQLQVERMMT